MKTESLYRSGSSLAQNLFGGSHREGAIARSIEEQTAKIPSDAFLWAAGASIAGSLMLQVTGRRAASVFVGQWAPTFLLLGIYNKIVKVAGSDYES